MNMSRARQFCDAYFNALIPSKTDPEPIRAALAKIPLPPAPAELWFWERVEKEFNKLKKEQ